MFVPGPSIQAEIGYDRNHLDQSKGFEEENKSLVMFFPRQEWDKPFVMETKKKELNSFHNYGAYKEVPYVGQTRLSSGWVVTKKLYGDICIVGCKARLVVHGNQGVEEVTSNSPTLTKQTLKMVNAVAAQYG